MRKHEFARTTPCVIVEEKIEEIAEKMEKNLYPVRDVLREHICKLISYNKLPKLRIDFEPGRSLTFGMLQSEDSETKYIVVYLNSMYQLMTVGTSNFFTNKEYKEEYLEDLPPHLMDKDGFAKSKDGFYVRRIHFTNRESLPHYVPLTWTDHNCFIMGIRAYMRKANFKDFWPGEGLTGRQERDLEYNKWKVNL